MRLHEAVKYRRSVEVIDRRFTPTPVLRGLIKARRGCEVKREISARGSFATENRIPRSAALAGWRGGCLRYSLPRRPFEITPRGSLGRAAGRVTACRRQPSRARFEGPFWPPTGPQQVLVCSKPASDAGFVSAGGGT